MMRLRNGYSPSSLRTAHAQADDLTPLGFKHAVLALKP
jgi:hypothetical protein